MTRVRDAWAAFCLTSILFGGLVLWTAVFFPFGFLAWCWQTSVGRVPSHMALRTIVQFYGTVCCKIFASQTPVTVENRAGVLPKGCIIAANHQSFFDAYCIGFFDVPAPTFMVRSWPFRIPGYGYIMRQAGYLDAESLDQEALLQRAGEVLGEGATLVVFPEGTRSTTGSMGRFRVGAFALAVAHGVPVIPLCIDGTGRVFPKGSRWGRPAPVRLILLPPVYPPAPQPGDALAHRCLQKEVKRAIHNALVS